MRFKRVLARLTLYYRLTKQSELVRKVYAFVFIICAYTEARYDRF